MKKVFAVMAIAGMFAFVACGPKAEEKTDEGTAATTEATTDQAATANQDAPATTDSTAVAADSTAATTVAQ